MSQTKVFGISVDSEYARQAKQIFAVSMAVTACLFVSFLIGIVASVKNDPSKDQFIECAREKDFDEPEYRWDAAIWGEKNANVAVEYFMEPLGTMPFAWVTIFLVFLVGVAPLFLAFFGITRRQKAVMCLSCGVAFTCAVCSILGVGFSVFAILVLSGTISSLGQNRNGGNVYAVSPRVIRCLADKTGTGVGINAGLLVVGCVVCALWWAYAVMSCNLWKSPYFEATGPTGFTGAQVVQGQAMQVVQSQVVQPQIVQAQVVQPQVVQAQVVQAQVVQAQVKDAQLAV